MRQTPSKFMAGAFAALTLALAGCAGSYGAGQATPATVGQASSVYEGTVLSVNEVQIRPDNSIIGAGVGAILGGLAGSELGGGDKAKTAGTVGGVVIGGVAGNEAGKALNTRKGFSYVVRLSNGDIKEIVQGADLYMPPNSRVLVTFRADGPRVTPLQAQQVPYQGNGY